MQRTIARYGWLPDLPDWRDHKYAIGIEAQDTLPVSADLRPNCPPVWSQGQLGSCSAHAIGGLFEFVQKKEGLKDFSPSRLFIYYNERAIEGTIDQDSGAFLRDGMKSLNWKGVCREDLMPYDVNAFSEKPKHAAYVNGLLHKAVSYSSVAQREYDIKHCLAAGYPIAFGFTVYEEFESLTMATTGLLPMPAPTSNDVGGHAVLLVGYSDAEQYFMVRNSWSANWGINGYFKMPYSYLLNPDLAADFWTLRLV